MLRGTALRTRCMDNAATNAASARAVKVRREESIAWGEPLLSREFGASIEESHAEREPAESSFPSPLKSPKPKTDLARPPSLCRGNAYSSRVSSGALQPRCPRPWRRARRMRSVSTAPTSRTPAAMPAHCTIFWRMSESIGRRSACRRNRRQHCRRASKRCLSLHKAQCAARWCRACCLIDACMPWPS